MRGADGSVPANHDLRSAATYGSSVDARLYVPSLSPHNPTTKDADLFITHELDSVQEYSD
jgi:hypothetical protein